MSIFDLKGQTAIVIGGAGGIGTEIAREYARAGVHVVLASRNQANLDQVREELAPISEQGEPG